MAKKFTMLVAALISIQSLFSLGCISNGGNLIPIPIPISPYFQKRHEDRHWYHERYARVPILGPVTSGGDPVALDPPSDDEVVRALEKTRQVSGGIPLLWERQRNNVRIVKELIADYVDPVRVYPLIGPAQQHHAHYKCTVYFSEATRVGWPVPYSIEDEDAVEVIYIDHNHLHMAGDVDAGGPATNY